MARWTWLVAAWLLGAAAATSAATEVSRGEPADAGRLSRTERSCQAFDAMREQTADLFRRPLTKEEYYKRNFMWLRCRTMWNSWFDMGGSWFGVDGKAIRDSLGEGVVQFDFHYVTGDWGDANFVFKTFQPLTLKASVQKLQEAAKRAMDRYGRTLYIIDCPGFQDKPYYATERAQTAWPRITERPPRDYTLARYNARDMRPDNYTE